MVKKLLSLISVSLLLSFTAFGQQNTLYEGFKSPSKDYYPRVWWHWMNGNVTKEGIKKDLEWMDRAGIAGFHQFNAQLNPTDVIVKERIPLFTDRWEEMFNYAIDVADSLGMEVAIASSPGWSITGGPWVTVEDAQKKLCWRTLDIKGGRRIKTRLPEPYRFSGPFQDKPQYPNDRDRYTFYKDIAVIAIRTEAIQKADTIAKWKQKAGFEMELGVTVQYPPLNIDNAINPKDILDISDKCHDGMIDWRAPKGNWTVYRFGYNLLGRVNGPVEKAGVGLEADKLSRRAMSNYYRKYLSIMDKASGHRLGSVIGYMMIDSYEAGKGTWTDDMGDQFKSRRGYDLTKWLPVLTGLPIENREKTEKFLVDWRETLGELLAENHYDLASEILKEYGMKRYGESHEWKTAFVGDGMRVKKSADIPMGAIWVRYGEGWYGQDYMSKADIRESASVAHIYGQNICAAESFTVNSGHTYHGRYPAYQCHPGNLKRLADAALSQGLNRFVMHCSPHQPEDSKFPGLGLGFYGNWFTRHDTWAEEAKSWHDYLARNCYMLQQGLYASDIAVFYGENINVTGKYANRNINVPKGYGFDLINADIILNELTIKDKRLYSKGGTSYRMILVDPENGYISEAVAKRLSYFSENGILICNTRDTSADPGKMLEKDGTTPDCIIPEIPGTDFYHVHRILEDGHIYWIANISPKSCDTEINFRVSGFKPMIWNAEDGSIYEASYRVEGGRTIVKLHFDADDSYMIVFTDKTDETELNILPKKEISSAEITGPWTVHFQKGREAPDSAVFDELMSYTESPDQGIKYFSGTAKYVKEFNYEGKSDKCILDLGETAVMARVFLNGKDLGLLWHAPYRIDISDHILKGRNKLEIAVTNLWANRLIGDSSKPRDERLTYTAFQFYSPDSPLPKSGLIGPVTITEYSY